MNSSSLLPRFRTVVINKLDVLLPAALLFLALFWIDCRRRDPDIGLFDHSSVWLALAILGGVIFETQNTGSQEFIFVWPVLLMILLRTKSFAPNHRIAVGILAAFFVIPTLTVILSKTARAIAVAPIYTPANAALLSNVGQVSARDDIMRRAQMLDEHYARFTAAYQDLADQDQLPSWQYYSELDNQMQWILSANRMIAAFHNFEKERGIRIESLMTLDFADPFPWILNRKTTPHIQIGGDPTRTVPAMTPDTMAAVEATQGVLKPKCPVTWGRDKIERIYDAALKDREIVHLDPCWDLLVRRDLVPSHE